MLKIKKKMNEIKYSNEVYYICKMNNQQLCVGLENGEIYIYNFQKDFSLILEIKNEFQIIFNIFIMKDNSILISTFSKIIIIVIDINKKKYKINEKLIINHYNPFLDTFAIETNNNGILCSTNDEIILWYKNNNNKFEIVKKIDCERIVELLELNNIYFVGIYFYENQHKILSIFDFENFQIIISLFGNNFDSGCLRKINQKIFIFINESILNFFDYEKMQIIKQISFLNLYNGYSVSTILKLKNDNLLISLELNKSSIDLTKKMILVEYEINNNKFNDYYFLDDNIIYCLNEYLNYWIMGGASCKLIILE